MEEKNKSINALEIMNKKKVRFTKIINAKIEQLIKLTTELEFNITKYFERLAMTAKNV